jgi:peroxiredoxin
MSLKNIMSLWTAGVILVAPKIYFSLEDAFPQDGDPVLLVFFSTQCPACRDELVEMKHFIEINRLDVHLVGVTCDLKEEVELFLDTYSIDRPVVLDARKKIHRKFRVDLIPYKVILKDEAVIYRDNYYQEFFERRKEAERCLLDICRK